MASDPTPGTRVLPLSAADNGSAVNVVPGDELLLKLPAQPGTGFSWGVVQCDRERIEAVGESVLEDAQRQGVGGAQAQVFRFRAKSVGTCVLELAYRRVFAPNDPPAETFAVEVHIRPV